MKYLRNLIPVILNKKIVHPEKSALRSSGSKRDARKAGEAAES